MSTASQQTEQGAHELGRSFAHVRKEVKRMNEQSRRTNRAFAQFEDQLNAWFAAQLANLGIKFTTQHTGDHSD